MTSFRFYLLVAVLLVAIAIVDWKIFGVPGTKTSPPATVATTPASIATPVPAPAPAAEAPTPAANNNAPPYLGVYRWGQGGCVKGLYTDYNAWINRNAIWPVDFMPTETWDGLEGQQWQLGTWEAYIQKQPGRRLILSVPLLPGSWDGKGPWKGIEAKKPVSFEEGAKGAYNLHFQHLAENLVKYRLGDSLLRLGWEFNGGWYTWRAPTAAKARAYAEYFHQIVTTMRAVPGAENLKFIWNPANEPWWPYPPETAWPGNDVVDYVGVDCYDQSWQKDTYPIPPMADAAETSKRREATWKNVTANEQKTGLDFWVKFAATHGKPLVIPEWGVCVRKDQHGGGDSAYFIQQMHDFIYNPANNVYFAAYFDVSAGDGDHRLIPEPDAKNPGTFKESHLPEAAAKFRELFVYRDGATASETAPKASAIAAKP